jgi:hypothetical protein
MLMFQTLLTVSGCAVYPCIRSSSKIGLLDVVGMLFCNIRRALVRALGAQSRNSCDGIVLGHFVVYMLQSKIFE